MITKFKVDGFKSLVLDEPIELGIVNVFIGANGAGKSNLLEALGVLGAATFGSVESQTLRYRGVRPGLPALYKTSFKGQRFRRLITLEAHTARAMYRIAVDNLINSPAARWTVSTESLEDRERPILTRSPRGCSLYNPEGKTEKISAPADRSVAKLGLTRRVDADEANRLIDLLDNYAIFSPTTPVLRGIENEPIDRLPLGLLGSGLPEAAARLFSKQQGSFGPFELDDIWDLIDWAEDISAVSAPSAPLSPAIRTAPVVLRFRDRFMRPERNTLSAYDASEGALYVLFMLCLCALDDAPRLFAVDNFDHALHPRVAAALTRMLCDQLLRDRTRQMLATTHNPLVLDGLDLRNDSIRLFAVDRDTSGVTRVRRVRISEDLADSSGLSLSRLWIMGRLGGVPTSL